MKIAPSILAADFLNLEEELKKLNVSTCEYIHLDIMDGHFVEDITFGAPIIKEISKVATKKLDVHLMVQNPSKIIDKLITIGVDIITIHAEIIGNIDFEYLNNMCMKSNVTFGIALNPNTKVLEYKKYIEKVDYILLMSVEPGKGGQKFKPEVLGKSLEIKQINKNIVINIDGGINDITIEQVKKYPIDIAVSGSFLFNGDIFDNIKRLKEC